MNFIYCLNESDKDKLIAQGYNMLQETHIGDKPVWVFYNTNNKKLDFNSKDIIYTNKLNF